MSEALTADQIRAIVRDEMRNALQASEERPEDAWIVSPHTLSPGKFSERFTARFWAKVNKDGPIPVGRPDLGPCWIWTAARYKCGGGKIKHGLDTLMAHRVGWVLHHGLELPGEKTIDHLCSVRACVRGDHLEPTSALENMRRAGNQLCAENRMKQACDHGHPFDEANTSIQIENGRWVRKCRACQRARYDDRKAKQHAAPRLSRPDADTLRRELSQFTAVQLSIRYGVSDRAIGLWARDLGVETRGRRGQRR